MRSPILGSIVLAFFIINWKPIWYLIFAEQSVAVKFLYFDLNTNYISLYILPITIGVGLGAASPWIRLFGAWLAIKPLRSWQRLQFDQRHDQKLYQLQREKEALDKEKDIEESKGKVAEARDRRAIESAQREKEAEMVGGKEAVDGLIDLRENHERSSELSPSEIAEKLSGREKAVILSMSEVSDPIRTFDLGASEGIFYREISAVIQDIKGVRLKVELESSLVELKRLRLAQSDNYAYWTLTSLGYAVNDVLRNA